MNLETKQLRFEEISDLHWTILLKSTQTKIGETAVVQSSDTAKLSVLKLEIEENVEEMMEEVMESLCNVVFYRLNCRKFNVDDAGDIVLKRVCEKLLFVDENDEISLYKEEYLRWLRKQGKALSFERLNSMRIVFLVVAFVGLILFGLDMVRKVNTLMTSLYAYITGIGAAGAILSSYMSRKQNLNQKDGENKNAG